MAQIELGLKRERINDTVTKRPAAGKDLGGRGHQFTKSQILILILLTLHCGQPPRFPSGGVRRYQARPCFGCFVRWWQFLLLQCEGVSSFDDLGSASPSRIITTADPHAAHTRKDFMVTHRFPARPVPRIAGQGRAQGRCRSWGAGALRSCIPPSRVRRVRSRFWWRTWWLRWRAGCRPGR